MRRISFSAEVHASRQTVWKLMLDKVENPGNFLPGVVGTTIRDRSAYELLREVRTQGMVIQERIKIDEPRGEIQYLLIEHPLFSGLVVNRVVPTSVQSPVAPQRFTIEADWIPRNEEAEQIIRTDLPAQIQQEVLSLKEKAEELEKGG